MKKRRLGLQTGRRRLEKSKGRVRNERERERGRERDIDGVERI